jgi:hypothetical protein
MVLAVGMRWASRGKYAGSADSPVLSARLRTPQPAKPADERSEESRRSSAPLRHSHYFAETSS